MDYRQLLRIMLQDTKQEELAIELKTTQATISRWLSGQEPRGAALERIRNLARARRLAEDATIEQSYDSSGTGNFREPGATLLRNRTRIRRGNGEISNISTNPKLKNANLPSPSDGTWSFPIEVKAGWQNFDQSYAILIEGDSMAPTLPNGSYAFVDTSQTYPSPPDLYAINYGHGAMVKRVELLPGDKIRIISDNGRYSDFEFEQCDVEVYGRVIASFIQHG
ncbi:MAG: LexA family transcriptional regulator [Rhizobiaceae bacterium]|nr:LexA family transcriptional regulator [Rhizobiaceae bacterium]